MTSFGAIRIWWYVLTNGRGSWKIALRKRWDTDKVHKSGMNSKQQDQLADCLSPRKRSFAQ